MTDELIAFLQARLDEDDRIARTAAEPDVWVQLNRQPRPLWHIQYWADPDQAAVIADPESSAYPIVLTPVGTEEADADNRVQHIARHDPARVLAEVEAKQEVMQLHSPGGHYHADSPRQYCQTCGSGEPHEYPTDWPCRTLRLLALPHADHPDYRDEWRP